MTRVHEDKMVKKARKKFVLGATAATFIAVLMLVLAINTVRYVQVKNQQEETLQSLTESVMRDKKGSGKTPKDEDDMSREYGEGDWENEQGYWGGHRGGRGSAAAQYGDRYFEIIMMYDGMTYLRTGNLDAMTEEEAREFGEEILKEGKEAGYKNDYRYLVRSGGDESVVISLLDCTVDSKSLSDLRAVTVAVGLLGTLFAFLFILFTSRRAVMPLEESMEKQSL